MNHITLTRTPQEISVATGAGELGFILRPEPKNATFEAWANQAPMNGFGRAAVESFKTLRDAVAFVQTEGVAL